MFFEIGATVFGLAQGALVMLNKRSNWIAYVLQMIFLLIFSLTQSLYGDAVNSGLYLILGIVGFVLWGRDGNRKITECGWIERILYTAIIAVGTFAVFLILRQTDDPLPLLDAFTTVSSLVATYYMLVKKTDAWILWFINNCFYVVEYWLLPDMAVYLLSLNVIWTVMAVGSYVNWRRIMKTQKKRVYFAGKFHFEGEGDLATRLQNDYRAILLKNSALLVYAQENLQLGKHIYVGPFYCEQASTGCYTSTDCNAVLKAEYTSVKNSDVFVAVFDESFSAGTVVELGWAIAQNKEILILYKEKEDSRYSLSSEYWFAIADAIHRGKRVQVHSYREEREFFALLTKYLEEV